MRKLIYTAFGANTPYAPAEIHKPGWKLPPAIVAGDAFEIDFTPLLVVDRLVLDKSTVEYVTSSKQPLTRRLQRSLVALLSEGFAETADFSAISADHEKTITNETERMISRLDVWQRAARKQMQIWQATQGDWKSTMGKQYDSGVVPTSYGVYCYLMTRDGKLRKQEIDRLTRLLVAKTAPEVGWPPGVRQLVKTLVTVR
jgi:hypothetical protein